MTKPSEQAMEHEQAPSGPNFLPQAYLHNRFLPFEDAHISIATHALNYGTAVLGGIRGLPALHAEDQVLMFRLEAHCQRLSRSAKYLGYSITPDTLQSILIDFVRLNRPRFPFYLRPLIYTSSLGIAPQLHRGDKELLIYGVARENPFEKQGVRCRISSWSRQQDTNQPLRGKTTAAYIASALAKTEAIESGFEEAILLNSQGKVSEASAMNLFLMRNGQLITPSFDQDILEGITRDSVLTLANDLGIPAITRPVDKSELFIADEIFLCGTAAQITPVLSVENYVLPSRQPITTRLKQQLRAVMEGQESRYAHWVNPIDWSHE